MAQGWAWLCYVNTPELEESLADGQSPRNQDSRDRSLARLGSLSFITLLITGSIPSSKSRVKYKGEAAIRSVVTLIPLQRRIGLHPAAFPPSLIGILGIRKHFSGSIGNAYRQCSALVFEAYACEIGVIVDRPRYRRSSHITLMRASIWHFCCIGPAQQKMKKL